jgi:hypothetical protein
MTLSHLLKRFNPPGPAHADFVDSGTGLPPENRNELPQPQGYTTEPTPAVPRRRGERTSSTGDHVSSSSPTQTFTLPLESTPDDPTPEAGARGMPMLVPLPDSSNAFLPNPSPGPLSETSLGPRPAAPEGLTEAWDLVKDGPSNSNLDRGLDSLGAFWMHGLRFGSVR